eukprot:403375521
MMTRIPNEILNQRYKLEKELGNGACGQVWEAEDLHNNQKLAIKFFEGQDIYQKELAILTLISGRKYEGLPILIDCGLQNEQGYMVMNKLGCSLQYLIQKRKQLLSSKTVFQIAIQLVSWQPHNIFVKYFISRKLYTPYQSTNQFDTHFPPSYLVTLQLFEIQVNNVKVLHELGFCHNDIKPDNVLFNSSDFTSADSSIISLIDFSASTNFLDQKTGQHLNMRISNEFNGNFAYSSKNQMMGICVLKQIIVYLDKLQYKDKPDYDFIIDLLLQHYPKSVKGVDWVMDWSKLSHKDVPFYTQLRICGSLKKSQHCRNIQVFQWNSNRESNCFKVKKRNIVYEKCGTGIIG